MFWFSKKKKEPLKEKEFKFSCWEIPCFGDSYHYTVKASDKEEAFKKLVNWFFGEDSNILQEDIKQQVLEIHYPGKEVFVTKGMPSWFGRRIGGTAINRETGEDYQKKLESYCVKNNIKLKK